MGSKSESPDEFAGLEVSLGWNKAGTSAAATVDLALPSDGRMGPLTGAAGWKIADEGWEASLEDWAKALAAKLVGPGVSRPYFIVKDSASSFLRRPSSDGDDGGGELRACVNRMAPDEIALKVASSVTMGESGPERWVGRGRGRRRERRLCNILV